MLHLLKYRNSRLLAKISCISLRHTRIFSLSSVKFQYIKTSEEEIVIKERNPPVDLTNLKCRLIIDSNTKEFSKWKPTPASFDMETDCLAYAEKCVVLSAICYSITILYVYIFYTYALVVISTLAGYAIAPAPVDYQILLLLTMGSTLMSSAANTINQYHEVPFDAQMTRTKNRVLVCGKLKPVHAMSLAFVSGVSGFTLLFVSVDHLTALLGLTNLILYTSVYTPLKRISITNTWVGSIVGAIPPLGGFAACTHGMLDPSAWLIASILFCWQFPHFNALSWNLRPEYSRAGYRMMSVTNPALCRRVALRHTCAIAGLSFLAPCVDATNYYFVVESLPLNLYFVYLAYQFYKNSDSRSSKKLFKYSLFHLPLIITLFLLNKKYWYKDDEQKNRSVTN